MPPLDAKQTMVDSVDDIAKQARQGSVSAIIQVLNEKLASSGIRTRAMFDQGVLQLLCEAAKPEQLEQSVLVPHVRQILESLQPRNVRRVKINSRIVREQQLLWLEEIHREPHNLLWSEEITLTKLTLLQRLMQDWKDNQPEFAKAALPKTSPIRLAREKRVFWRGLLGGASLSLFLLLLALALLNWLSPKWMEQPQTNAGGSSTAEGSGTSSPNANSSQAAIAPSSSSSPTPEQAKGATETQTDPFAQAVRLAEETAGAGHKAQSSADWLDLASRWQHASELMGQVSPQDPRYATAQDRVERYRQNSKAALQQAQNKQE
jgi:hypothetical protein